MAAASPHEGNYSSWLDAKAKRLAQEAREDKAKQKVLEKELEWIRAGAKARQAKSKARIQAYEKMADESVKELVGKARSSSGTAPASAPRSSSSRTCRRPSATSN